MRAGRLAVGCAALLVCLSATLVARAEEKSATPDVQEAELDARLAELDRYFEELERPTRLYTIGWISGLSALTVVQTGLAVVEDDPAFRTTLIVGASLSVLGAVTIAALPRRSRQTSRAYQALSVSPTATKAQRLAMAEELLRQHVRSLDRTRSWYMHLAGGVLGVGVTLGIGLAYDDFWLRAVLAGVGAVAGVEGRVWTHPTRARKLAARYQGHWPDFQLVPVAAPHAVGLSMRAVF
jgi:hypothetical protein